MIKRIKTRKLHIGDVPIGGDSPISVQSMTWTKTTDIPGTIAQIRLLHFSGADIVRVAVPDMPSAVALKQICSQTSMPIVADIHFNYRLALEVAPHVQAVRFNPGNIGDKNRIKLIIDRCKEFKIPVRVGVNCGSLESKFEDKYGQTAKGMIQSALYNIKYLEDLDFRDIKVSLKASDVQRTVEAYRGLRPLVDYAFHIGVTEAGTRFHSTVKSSIALGSLLLDGIGDTMRVSMTGELEEEIKVAKAILKDSGIVKDGVNIISCPTCGRLEADLVSAVAQVEHATKDIKTPLNISVMGCVVNALGEAKSADVAIAYGKGSGLIIKKGEIVAKLPTKELLPRLLVEIDKLKDDNYDTA